MNLMITPKINTVCAYYYQEQYRDDQIPISLQRLAVRHYCEKHGKKLIAEYFEPCLPNQCFETPVLDQLIQDWKGRAIWSSVILPAYDDTGLHGMTSKEVRTKLMWESINMLTINRKSYGGWEVKEVC